MLFPMRPYSIISSRCGNADSSLWVCSHAYSLLFYEQINVQKACICIYMHVNNYVMCLYQPSAFRSIGEIEDRNKAETHIHFDLAQSFILRCIELCQPAPLSCYGHKDSKVLSICGKARKLQRDHYYLVLGSNTHVLTERLYHNNSPLTTLDTC